ncbi:MAG: hypothetical protein AB7M12_07685 [Hyphomonadaceae bacterium]
MPSKANLNGPPREIAEREARLRRALSEAESALAAGEPVEAERRAKALSAIAKAYADIMAWKEKAVESARLETQEEDDGAFRRELEIRFDRFRAEAGLEPVFDGADEG